jgi:hypothetical protein
MILEITPWVSPAFPGNEPKIFDTPRVFRVAHALSPAGTRIARQPRGRINSTPGAGVRRSARRGKSPPDQGYAESPLHLKSPEHKD